MWKTVPRHVRGFPWERPLRGVVAEVGYHLLDVQTGVADAITAEPDQVGGTLDAGGEHIDIHIGALQLPEDGLQLGERGGIATRDGLGHVEVSSTRLRAVPL